MERMEGWKINKQTKTRHITSDTINLQVKIKGGNSGEKKKKKSIYKINVWNEWKTSVGFQTIILKDWWNFLWKNKIKNGDFRNSWKQK